MLEEMRLQGLGVIDEAVLELDPGLTVVTGETGAGKTMVVTGLSLLLGSRTDPGLVRTGAERAVVEGRMQLDPKGPTASRAVEIGAELEDDVLIVMRTISREGGRSRAYAGGAGVPAAMLAELAEELVTVHGQSDQIRLLRPAKQRELLDRFAGEAVSGPFLPYREKYLRLGVVSVELKELTTLARERAQEADMLRFGLEEIEAIDPQPGEDQKLAEEDARLAHADGLRAAAEYAHVALVGDEDPGIGATDVLSLLASARKQLEPMRSHDPKLETLGERLGDLAALAADVGADLGSYASGIDTDSARLATVGDRRADLSGLTRKYGDTIDDVLTWAENAANRLLELDGSDDRIAELRAEQTSLRQELADLASQVSSARTAAAEKIGAIATDELSSLAMPHAVLTVAISQTETDQDGLEIDGRTVAYGPHGIDDVELLLRPHPGAPPRPLNKGASGGELSRVMLAVELTTAGPSDASRRSTRSVPTFVFDEVDAGVGGVAAVEIGRRLAQLARTAQVIVVTHLPQVAAFADRHYVVRKSSDGTVTRSGLTRLEDSGRVDELARMLAGQEDSATARAHAEELLTTASAGKRKRRTKKA